MSALRRSCVVMDKGLASRKPLLPFLLYWDGDRLEGARHDGDARRLRSFTGESNPRPWVVIATKYFDIGGTQKLFALISPVASTWPPLVRDIDSIPLPPDLVGSFPRKKTYLRTMLAMVVMADEIEIPRDWTNCPLHLDQLPEIWEAIDEDFCRMWPEERCEKRMRQRAVVCGFVPPSPSQAKVEGVPSDPSMPSAKH